jgi:hypothetical protein
VYRFGRQRSRLWPPLKWAAGWLRAAPAPLALPPSLPLPTREIGLALALLVASPIGPCMHTRPQGNNVLLHPAPPLHLCLFASVRPEAHSAPLLTLSHTHSLCMHALQGTQQPHADLTDTRDVGRAVLAVADCAVGFGGADDASALLDAIL